MLEDEELSLTTFNTLLAQSNYREALTLSRAALDRYPENPEALRILGGGMSRLGDWRGALVYFKKAAQISPREGIHWRNLALALTKTGQYEDALEPATQSISLNPGQEASHFHHALLLHLTGDRPAAEALLTEANGAFKTDRTFTNLKVEYEISP